MAMRKSIRILGMVIRSRRYPRGGDALSRSSGHSPDVVCRTIRSSLAARLLAAHTYSRRQGANLASGSPGFCLQTSFFSIKDQLLEPVKLFFMCKKSDIDGSNRFGGF